MVAASQTLLSTTGIWVMVIAMTALLAIWLTAIVLADRSQARASGRSRMTDGTGPALDGAWAGGSVAGARAPEIPGEAVHEPVETSGDAPGTEARGGPPTGRHERPPMPRQRSGEGDRAERSYAGPATPDDEQPDR